MSSPECTAAIAAPLAAMSANIAHASPTRGTAAVAAPVKEREKKRRRRRWRGCSRDIKQPAVYKGFREFLKNTYIRKNICKVLALLA